MTDTTQTDTWTMTVAILRRCARGATNLASIVAELGAFAGVIAADMESQDLLTLTARPAGGWSVYGTDRGRRTLDAIELAACA